MKKKHINILKNGGFTLVEIIVVFVILAIVVAIAVPMLLSHIDEANKKNRVMEARTFMSAIQTQMTDEYVNYITNGDSEVFTENHFSDSTNDINLNGSSFTDKILNKTGLEKPYLLLMYTKAYDFTSENTEGINKGIKVYSIVYWPVKDEFPLYYNFDSNSWEYGNLYTAGFMHRGADKTEDKNIILSGHNYAGELIKIYLLCYDGNKGITQINDEMAEKMKEYS